MTKEELEAILEQHNLWLNSNEKEDKCADLSYADLSYADLSCANLSYADLSNADLSYAEVIEFPDFLK